VSLGGDGVRGQAGREFDAGRRRWAIPEWRPFSIGDPLALRHCEVAAMEIEQAFAAGRAVGEVSFNALIVKSADRRRAAARHSGPIPLLHRKFSSRSFNLSIAQMLRLFSHWTHISNMNVIEAFYPFIARRERGYWPARLCCREPRFLVKNFVFFREPRFCREPCFWSRNSCFAEKPVFKDEIPFLNPF